MQVYDAIVLGLGAMGSATVYHLQRRGQRVLGLDAHPRGHDLGSSHGRSRIIREAYFEAPEYVPLVRRAFKLWRDLEVETDRDLLTITGGINIGPPDGDLVSGALHSVRQHRIEHEYLAAAEIRERFPGFRPTDDLAAVYEPTAGFLDPEACVGAHLDAAAHYGAELHHAEPAHRWSVDGAGVRVETGAETYRADRLVITAGPWAGQTLAGLGLPLEVWRMVNAHFEPSRPDLFAADRCPVYIWQIPEGDYFGFPNLPGQGVKFGRHDNGEPCSPDTARRQVDESEIVALRQIMDRYMPGASGEVKWTLTCLYTLTPDRHFVVDRHPAHPQVAFACGFSGHGFKFSAVIGEVLADLATVGRTDHPIGFLSATRFGARPKR